MRAFRSRCAQPTFLKYRSRRKPARLRGTPGAGEGQAALRQHPGKLVLGADTIVVVDGEILGKPRDEADAMRMLRLLSGRTHQVITGVCLVGPH